MAASDCNLMNIANQIYSGLGWIGRVRWNGDNLDFHLRKIRYAGRILVDD